VLSFTTTDGAEVCFFAAKVIYLEARQGEAVTTIHLPDCTVIEVAESYEIVKRLCEAGEGN